MPADHITLKGKATSYTGKKKKPLAASHFISLYAAHHKRYIDKDTQTNTNQQIKQEQNKTLQ